MRIDVVTIFPEIFPGPLGVGVLGRARERGLLEVTVWDLRAFTEDRHRSVDDAPYGGGAGMVMKVEPFARAVDAVRAAHPWGEPAVLLTSPQGVLFTQARARAYAAARHLVLLCGRYEGVDDRVAALLGAEEVSVGDYVLTGGELAAMVVADAVVRLLPGVLGSGESLLYESHTGGLLEYPQYTRPEVYRGWGVPDILRSGNHGEIAKWRREQSLKRTAERRPDLLGEKE